MPKGLIIFDNYLVTITKSGRLLATLGQLCEFLEFWHSVSKYVNEIFLCLQTNRLSLKKSKTNLLFCLLSRTQRKNQLLSFLHIQEDEKYRQSNVSQNAQMTTLWDQWLIAQSKTTLKTKAQIKKAVDTEKKKAEKEVKACEKAQNKNQSLEIRGLVLNNNHIVKVGTFRDILLDCIDKPIGHIYKPTGKSTSKPVIFTIAHLEVS